MIERVEVEEPVTIEDYEQYVTLRTQVRALRRTAKERAGVLEDRTVWMVNSAREGGGVAEMMPKLVALLRETGIRTEWLVIRPKEEKFFALTKRLHNLLHGTGNPDLTGAERQLYRRVSRQLADEVAPMVGPDDVLAVHDPQPAGVGAFLKRDLDVPAVWRCHVGLDEHTPETRAAWSFLEEWVTAYDRAAFTLPAYAPSFLEDRLETVRPGIDPLSHKNRELSVHKLAGICTNASLVATAHPAVSPPFEHPALRLQHDGSFAPAVQPEGLGLLFRPVVTQISRWDRLKGFEPLLEGFVRLKRRLGTGRGDRDDRHRLRLELARLVLAGPDPDAIADDPESREVFESLRARWLELEPALQRDVALIRLPMESRKINALMVNVLQRSSVAVVQNSLREGFGLTVTEAMWKGVPVVGSRAAGIAAQIEDGRTGRLVDDPRDPEQVADRIDEMLESEKRADAWATNARRRVANEHLVTSQVIRWMELLADLVEA